MRSLLILFTLGTVVLAIPYQFHHDIKMNVYSVLKYRYATASLSAYLHYLARDGEIKFSNNFFHFTPKEKIHEVLLIYQPTDEDYLHGYYIRTGNGSKYDDEFFTAIRPIDDYLNSGEYYGFCPYAAKQAARDHYYAPLKKIFYQYYSDVDLHHEVPVVFIVPKNEVSRADLEDLILIVEYEVTKNGTHDIHEYPERHVTPRPPCCFYPIRTSTSHLRGRDVECPHQCNVHG